MPTHFDYDAERAGYSWNTPETFNFATDVVDVFAKDPNKLAVVWRNDKGDERRLTFADVLQQSSQVANWLVANGVKKGDRVIVMLPRTPEWHVALTACLRIGAVAIPCISMLSAKDVAYRANHAGAAAAIASASDAGKFADLNTITAKLCIDGAPHGWAPLSEATAMSDRCAPARVGAGEPAIMYYTSGSTGAPKGVLHAARALHGWRVAGKYFLNLGPDDLMWCTADTGWSKAGTSILFGPWSMGAAVFFYDGAFDARRRLELIAELSVTVFCGVATELRRLAAEDMSGIDFSSLALTVSAGESVNPEVLEAWTKATGAPLLDGYGQTETLITVTNMLGAAVKPGSMGRPLPGIEAAIIDASGVARDRSIEGELCIADHPQILLEYWNDPERTGAIRKTSGGRDWIATGDRVRIDNDGYIFYLGRDDDLISSAGYRIGPQEVENALQEHPAVRESAVIGAPDAERGSVVKAFVVLEANAKADAELTKALQNHVKAVAAPYKYPRLIEYVTDLPKTLTGKVQRSELRRREIEKSA